MQFSGKVVLVTGAAQGIGLAIVKAFLEAGARVALNDQSQIQVDTGLQKLTDRSDHLAGVVADVTQRDQVDAMIHSLIERWHRLDILVNNAGLYPVTPFLELDESEWDRVLNVNLKGVFLVSQVAARLMVQGGTPGVIVNISSGSYQTARLGCAHYCASKAGVVMLTKVMAMELAPHGIRVNSVAPGLIHVPESMTPVDPDYAAATLSAIPWQRLGRPEDVAQAVLLLCAEEADYITGAVLAVDGGLSAGRMPPSARG